MLCLIVVAALLALVNAGRLPEVHEVAYSSVNITKVSYLAALLLDSSSTGAYSLTCGGAIISKSVVVTAAHCINGTKPSQWRVRVGSNQHNSGGQLVDVSSFMVHHGFNSRLNNDIALVFLDSMLVLGDTSRPAYLPGQGLELRPGTGAYVTGWGTIQEGRHGDTSLSEGWFQVTDPQQCKDAYHAINPDQPVTEKMVCFHAPETCLGDSGGPLTLGGGTGVPALVGLASWGMTCNNAVNTGVFTKVSAFVSWIYANI